MPKKIFPKHEMTLLLDDVREEKHNKISLMGLYNNVILIDPESSKTISKLCFFTRAHSGSGTFKTKLSLLTPNGDDMLASMLVKDLELNPDMPAIINVAVSPFKVDKEGEYIYSVTLEGKTLCTLKISIVFRKPA